MAAKIAEALGINGDLTGKTIGVLGLTFKANTDDMREAPSLVIVPALQAMGATIKAFDPQGNEAKALLPGVTFTNGIIDTVQDADAVVILTEWDQFRAMDLAKVKAALKTPIMIDLRNLYESKDMRAQGFRYVNIGEREPEVSPPADRHAMWARAMHVTLTDASSSSSHAIR